MSNKSFFNLKYFLNINVHKSSITILYKKLIFFLNIIPYKYKYFLMIKFTYRWDKLEGRRWKGLRREEMGKDRKSLLWCKNRNLVASTSNGDKSKTTFIHLHPPSYLSSFKPSSPFRDIQFYLW